jgi:dTDP-glucose 4,6-dehydratase
MKENKKRILITGIGGFLGCHCVDHYLVNTDWEIVGIDSWAHKGVPERILDSEHYQNNKERVTIFTHDLTSPISQVLIDRIGHVDYILNLASLSHVDTSITDPVPFMRNNIDIVINMLEYAKVVKPEKFIQFSTDEVYGPMLNDYAHPEWDPILPSNPYSASKAAQEAIAISYWRTYSVPVIVTNTMNLIGEKQDGEKYLPKIVKNVKEGTSLTIHAQNGVAGSRFYLHCRNAADACMFIFNNVDLQMFPDFNEPVRLNIVGKTELNNLDLAKKVADIMGKELKYEFIDVHSVRPGHDPKYGLDGTKLRELGYEYPIDFDETLKRTIDWMMRPENAKFIEKL